MRHSCKKLLVNQNTAFSGINNCSGQNKNWYLFTGHVQCVNTWGPETITIKYLEKGRTFIVADGVHANNGKLFHKTSTVSLFMTSSNSAKRQATT